MKALMPALFVSHGAPTILVEPCPAREFLQSLGGRLPRPLKILVVSAHWTTVAPRVTAHPNPPTVHDFGGFDGDLYGLEYEAPGDPVLAQQALRLLANAGLPGERDMGRGFDHGAWVPLKLIYPGADIPVVQLSVQPHLGGAHHLAIGRALLPLREEGVLILASGSSTHDLSGFWGQTLHAEPPAYASEFADWLKDSVSANRVDDLVAYETHAPYAKRNHPTPEHFLPLLVALGAGGGEKGTLIHDSNTYGVISMAAFQWGGG